MKCIYCRRPSGRAKGFAHVFPEALFENDYVLPRGTVCDHCNNYLSDLDSVLIAHNHIWPTIQILGLPGKRGRARTKLGYMERAGSRVEWRMRIQQKDISKIVFDSEGVHIETKNPPEFDDLKFRRALYHIAFNFFAMRTSADHVLQSDFDAVRRYIRQPHKNEKWPYSQVIVSPTRIQTLIGADLAADAPGKTVVLRIFSDDFYVDLLNSGGTPALVQSHASREDPFTMMR